MPFYFEVITDGANHKELPSICTHEDLGFIEPGVGSKVAYLGQLLDFLVGFEGIVFDLKQLEDVAAGTADEMGLSGANSYGVSAFDAEVAHRETPAPRYIEEHELAVWFSRHAAGVLRLRGGKCNDFETRLLISLRQLEVFNL